MLIAEAAGVNTLALEGFDDARVRSALGIPERCDLQRTRNTLHLCRAFSFIFIVLVQILGAGCDRPWIR